MPFLLVRYAGKPPLRYEMTTDAVTVGSERSCELPLTDKSAAPRHCRIELRGESYYLTDLSGKTLLNGRKLGSSETRLCNGDEIGVGGTRMSFDDPHSPRRSVIERLTTRIFGFKEKPGTVRPGFIRCSSCGATVHVGTRPSGAQVGCPRCKSVQKVP